MNTPYDGREVAATGRPPAPLGEPRPGTAVTPAGPVLDADLLDDHQPRRHQHGAAWT
ncbi:MAG TPA: hypothetical protein VFQ77_00095 [Pseudonocardiaceae bacterium]|jgi:hypothetical protein|nr:hypothetical protein [Pseudonocardiaceae bacterium]